MNRDDIIKMAREAGLPMQYRFVGGATHWDFDGPLEKFAALVAAAEREECAKVAAWILKMPENDVSFAIRQRGAS